jgi:CTP:molybdopterin cytidylyltransferase MocA
MLTVALLTALRAADGAPVLCVLGARATDVRHAVPAGVEVVVNEDWADGLSSSVRAAIRVVGARHDVGAVCFGLGDQPLVGADAYRRLRRAHARGAHLAVATYGGARRNPVLVDRTHFADIAALRGDRGVRQLMGSHPVTEVPCDDTGDPVDVDTSSDLALVAARTAARGHESRDAPGPGGPHEARDPHGACGPHERSGQDVDRA